MARSFWRGIIAGGFIGGLVSKLLAPPQRKSLVSKDFKKQMGKMGFQAKKAMEDAKGGIKEFYRKK